MALDPATISAGISIGKSLFGGKSKKKAAKKASRAQEAAALRQEKAAKEFDTRTQKQTEPYRQFGEGATSKLSDYLGIDSANPDYSRAESDYNNAQAEYSKLLNEANAPTPQSKGNNSIFQGFRLPPQRGAANPARDALIADAKGRLAASRAKLDGTQRTSGRSSTFGSLLKPFEMGNQFSEEDLDNDVVYNKGLEFGLNEGTKGLERRNLAMGGYDSGAALKELTRYANDYGETKAGGAEQRFSNNRDFRYNAFNSGRDFTFNSLLNGSNVGQNAIGQSIGASGTALNGVTSGIAGVGNARAGGAFARGAANSEMFENIGKQFDGFKFGDIFGKKPRMGGGLEDALNKYGGKTSSGFGLDKIWN